jgi:hypothetical protein
MSAELDIDAALLRRARSAYELGRIKLGSLRAALLTLAVAGVGSWLFGSHAWRWAPLTFAAWTLSWWRGGVLLRSSHYGLAAGAIAFLLPMSVLRPCCRPGMQGPVCTMPEMCVLAGMLVGLPLAVLGLRQAEERPYEAALGMALGVLSLVAMKCAALFVGEALGLLGGITLGIAAASAVTALTRSSQANR